jgi:ATP-dependent DNA ligase
VQLPVSPPQLSMLARRLAELPADAGWIYEPKWDGLGYP